jgi:regulator of ribonuclease activity A
MPDLIPTADLVDQHGDALASSDLQLRQYGGLPAFTGTVRTVRCFQDNALVKQVLATPGEGQVLVVDGDESLHSALMGEVDVPVSFGGVTYRPGQQLWSDDDGIVVLDQSTVA